METKCFSFQTTQDLCPQILAIIIARVIFLKEINFEMCKYVVEVEDGGRVAMWGDTGYNKPLHCIKSLI